jgi:hypothetical protein
MGLSKPLKLPAGRQQAFDALYEQRALGHHETISGIGSMLSITRALRAGLADFFDMAGITSITDIGCGDHNWMAAMPLAGIRYIGIDMVAALVAQNRERHGEPQRRFEQLDAAEQPPPPAMLALCRDVFNHLPPVDTQRILAHLAANGTQLLAATTNHVATPHKLQHTAQKTLNSAAGHGYWRAINLCEPPFNLPPPLLRIMENQPGKTLDIWRMDEVAQALSAAV